jgi:hypothetical protein
MYCERLTPRQTQLLGPSLLQQVGRLRPLLHLHLAALLPPPTDRHWQTTATNSPVVMHLCDYVPSEKLFVLIRTLFAADRLWAKNLAASGTPPLRLRCHWARVSCGASWSRSATRCRRSDESRRALLLRPATAKVYNQADI